MSIGLFRRFWLPWTFVALLSALCAVLAVVQYGWINQISNTELARREAGFQASLNGFGRDFDSLIAASFQRLQPSADEIAEWGVRAACIRQYRRWSDSSDPLFARIGIVYCPLASREPSLELLDVRTGQFVPAAWPDTWAGLYQRFEARMVHGPLPKVETTLLEAPLPDVDDPAWLIAELSLDDLHTAILPGLAEKYLTGPGAPFDIEIQTGASPAKRRGPPDATVDLLGFSGVSRWRLAVYHRGVALRDQVTIARGRNVALSGGILLLILAIVLVLVQSARRSEQLAELQMNFVAGVSHELRTPLTVIRTAAYNLRGRLASKPDQVEKYASLIQKETEALSGVVEQVLRYGAATSGRPIGARRPISANRLIVSSIRSSTLASAPQIAVEQTIDVDLPPVLGDELALKHALENLIDNAVKYGSEGAGWVGISAHTVEDHFNRMVEIRVADRGPGIPLPEQPHIFEAFFRGRRAIQDQMSGTGLGLNLVKRIIEAHGGKIQVRSESGRGAEFVVRLPVAEEEIEDAFSSSSY